MSLYQKYLSELRDPHNINGDGIGNMKNRLDFTIRKLMGKTDNIEVAKCSHAYILEHEQLDDELRCRQCGINLNGVYPRINDYLVIRHPKCKSPICLECSKNRPDIFNIRFKEAIAKLGCGKLNQGRKGVIK